MNFTLDDHDDSWLQRLREAETATPLKKIGPYVALQEVSRGGQGVVFRARQPGTSRDIALKRLIGGRLATSDARARFDREVRMAAALNHPNIVTIFGVEAIDDQPVLAMEWVDGVPLDRWARGRDRDEILGCFLDVCSAIRHAHQRGVIHRDLKPSNILVDENGKPHVLDFGLAKPIETDDSAAAQLTHTAEFLGTPAYAAPEQVRRDADAIDTRSDVYALGALLYELMTGQTPFPADSGIHALLNAIETEEPTRPSRVGGTCDRELELIILKALAKDPERRYQSVDALADDLQRYRSNEPISAHPPSAAYQFRALIRRHRAPFAIAGGFALLLAAFAIVSTWQAFRLEQERNDAIAARELESDARASAETVNKFLQDMLVAARPNKAQGEDISVSQIVDTALERVNAGLIDRPRVEASIRLTLGKTLYSLGRHDEAMKQLLQSREMLTEAYGSHHPDVLDAVVNIANVHNADGKLATAAEYYTEAITAYREMPTHAKELSICLSNLATVRMRETDLTAARALLEECQQIQADLDDADPEIRIGTLLHLGGLYSHQGDLEAAERVTRTALDLAESEMGKYHEQTLAAMNNLGILLKRLQRKNEAAPYYEEAAQRAHHAFGEDHPRTLLAQGNYALMLQSLDRFDEAEPLYQRVLTRTRATLGEDHPNSISTAMNLGSLWKETGDFENAEELLRETLTLAERVHGIAHPTTGLVLGNLGHVLQAGFDGTREDEALQCFQRTLEIFQNALPPGHPYIAQAEKDVASMSTPSADESARSPDAAAVADKPR